ncbi:hypothetical protein CISECK367B_23405 [Citrobacter sedlakii]
MLYLFPYPAQWLRLSYEKFFAHIQGRRCEGLVFAVSSMGRCNAILNHGGRCHETKNSD